MHIDPGLNDEIDALIEQLDMSCDEPVLCREAAGMIGYLQDILIGCGKLPARQDGAKPPMGVITTLDGETHVLGGVVNP